MAKLCLAVQCLSLLHFLQSSRVLKHLHGVNAFVISDMQSESKSMLCSSERDAGQR